MRSLTDPLVQFVKDQPMFFVATAAAEGRVNVSPKGMDTLRVLAADRVVWLSLSGSGNETAAHVLASDRMTLMFCSFDDVPMILRLYGTATVVHPRDEQWDELIALFPALAGARQIYDMRIDEVLTSCGSGVPIMEVQSIRGDAELEPFYAAMSDEELRDYWSRKNVASIDGFPTAIFADPNDIAIGRLDVTALDCPDPVELARFYRSLLGGELLEQTHDGWIELHTAHGRIAFQQIDHHQPPTWPDGDTPQQAHLDIDVDNLDVGERAALARGATKAATQPSPENFRVFLDPVGHPFCLVKASGSTPT